VTSYRLGAQHSIPCRGMDIPPYHNIQTASGVCPVFNPAGEYVFRGRLTRA